MTQILVCGAAIVTMSMGIRHGFGFFLLPMTADLHWSRETFALALAVQNLVWGVTQPFAGMLADKYGSGRVVLGVGINVNQTRDELPRETVKPPTSLRVELDRELERAPLLVSILAELELGYEAWLERHAR